MASKTVGQIFDERGPCVLMTAVVELAEAYRRIPCGHWIVDLGDKFELEVNGTKEAINGIQPWESMIRYLGLPVASFNAVEGCVLGWSEDRLISIIRHATKRQLATEQP